MKCDALHPCTTYLYTGKCPKEKEIEKCENRKRTKNWSPLNSFYNLYYRD